MVLLVKGFRNHIVSSEFFYIVFVVVIHSFVLGFYGIEADMPSHVFEDLRVVYGY